MHAQQEHEQGLQLLGVLQVGFTPMPPLTALLLFKCGECDQQQQQQRVLMASSAVWMEHEMHSGAHTDTR